MPSRELYPLPYVEPQVFLKNWPAHLPLLFLGGAESQYAFLALAFYEQAFSDICSLPLYTARSQPSSPPSPPFMSGYWGLLPYEAFAHNPPWPPSTPGVYPARIFRVNRCLVFDQQQRTLFIAKGQEPRRSRALKPLSPLYELPAACWQKIIAEHRFSQEPSPSLPSWELKPHTREEDYLSACRQAIAEIRDGRFYQINLLRYFSLYPNLEPSQLISLLMSNGGPYSAIFALDEVQIYSLSPEKFIQLAPSASGLCAYTYPIKGTAPRSSDFVADQGARHSLAESSKDQAELHMIVDLMRNDLNRISQRASVAVLSPGKIVSFKHVHHLVACISSRLLPRLSFGDFLAAVCPAGSITGAPKREVMAAIAEYEKRPRGFFMGNIFYWDDGGNFDSSVLIRTLVTTRSANERLEGKFAAGSGIVIHSQAEQEREEIQAKCRVVCPVP